MRCRLPWLRILRILANGSRMGRRNSPYVNHLKMPYPRHWVGRSAYGSQVNSALVKCRNVVAFMPFVQQYRARCRQLLVAAGWSVACSLNRAFSARLRRGWTAAKQTRIRQTSPPTLVEVHGADANHALQLPLTLITTAA